MALIVAALVQWPILLYAIGQARRNRESALTFTVGVFIVLTLVSTIGAVLSLFFLLDLRLPSGSFTVTLIGIFLGVALPQPLWYLGVRLGRFK